MKMLKEEETLRNEIRWQAGSPCNGLSVDEWNKYSRLISALVKAVREDDAKMVESKIIQTDASGKWKDARGGKEAMMKLAAALRGKGGK